eukprot:1424633-Pleurochrysis_carterae.AAC.1
MFLATFWRHPPEGQRPQVLRKPRCTIFRNLGTSANGTENSKQARQACRWGSAHLVADGTLQGGR